MTSGMTDRWVVSTLDQTASGQPAPDYPTEAAAEAAAAVLIRAGHRNVVIYARTHQEDQP